MIRVVSVEPLPQYRLKVTFDDGLSGVFSVEPERRGGVFMRLLDAKLFNAVTVNSDFGCVEWPGGIDLAPDTLHEAMAGLKPQAINHPSTALHETPKKQP